MVYAIVIPLVLVILIIIKISEKPTPRKKQEENIRLLQVTAQKKKKIEGSEVCLIEKCGVKRFYIKGDIRTSKVLERAWKDGKCAKHKNTKTEQEKNKLEENKIEQNRNEFLRQLKQEGII